MNKQLIMSLTPLALLVSSFSASAIDVYKDDVNTVSIKGYMSADYLNADGTDEFADSASRIGFHFSREMSDGWRAFAGLEYGTDMVQSGDSLVVQGDALRSADDSGDALWTRLGFFGAEHEKWGKFSVGKQWGVFYAVTETTDVFEIFGGEASGTYNYGTDGGFIGTGRADKALQWRKSYGGFSIGLQAQFTEEDIKIYQDTDTLLPEVNPLAVGDPTAEAFIDNTMGATLIYEFDFGLSVGGSYNTAEIEVKRLDGGQDFTDDDEIFVVGVWYGNWNAEGFYAAVNYNSSENHEIDDQGRIIDATGIEIALSYGFGNWSVYGGLNHLEEDEDNYGDADDEQFELEYYVIGGAYRWQPDISFYAEFKLDDSSDSDGGSYDDIMGVGFKFVF